MKTKCLDGPRAGEEIEHSEWCLFYEYLSIDDPADLTFETAMRRWVQHKPVGNIHQYEYTPEGFVYREFR